MRDRPRAPAPPARGARAAVLSLALLCQGFDWPGRAERLVNTLTSTAEPRSPARGRASTPRDRRDALRLLGELAAREGLPPGLDLTAVEAASQNVDPDVRAEAWSLLAVVHRDPERLEPALRDVSPVVRLAALTALRRLAPEHEALVRAITDVDPPLRAAAVSMLASRRDARAVSLLASALRDVSIEVRVAAVRALGKRPEPEALTLVIDAADELLPELRVAALDALGAPALRSPPEGVETTSASAHRLTCQRALDDGDQAVVLAALRCLLRGQETPAGARANDTLDPRLSALARSLSPIVASAATHLIDRQLPARPETWPTQGPEWLALLEQTARPALSATQAASLLSQLETLVLDGESLAADPLLEWLPRAPSSLRVRIARLIERTHATLASRLVLALLSADAPRYARKPEGALRLAAGEPEVALASERAAYVRLLAQTSGPDSDARLLALLDDPSREVRAAAVFAAARAVDGALLTRLLDRLDDTTGTRRRDTLWVLTAVLERQRRTGSALEVRMERALVRSLRGDLAERDDASAALALSALGSLRTDEAHAAVRAAMADARPGRSIAALRASILDRSDQARAARGRIIVHPDPRVGATAMVALALAGDPLPIASALGWLRNAAWPRGPAASFALARGVANNDATLLAFDPCPWLTSDEPITRHNMSMARVRRSSPTCGQRDLDTRKKPSTPASFTARTTDEPAALRLEDSTVIVSIPDASGRIAWPGVAMVEEVSAFLFLGDEM